MWSAVTFGCVFGIADDEAQMAEVMVTLHPAAGTLVAAAC